MSQVTFKVSAPTKTQVVSSVERIVVVFLVAAFAEWRLFPHPFSKAALLASGIAGATAVYQVVLSFLTTVVV